MAARSVLPVARTVLVGLVLLALGVGTGLFIGSPRETPPPAPTAPTPPPDFARLKELAERLIMPPGPMPAPDGPRAELIPGGLPADLPVEVPVPEGARLLGSLATPGIKGDGPSWVIVFDVPGSVADAVAFYRDALMARGWTPPPGIAKAGGFRATIEPGATTFCKGPGGPWLTLEATGRSGDTADVRVRISANAGPCGQPAAAMGKPLPPGMERLPALYPPRGVVVTAAGITGSGPNHWSSDATAETDLSPVELEAYFAAQLKAAGWTRLGGLAQGVLAWSVWSVPGEGNWQGLLYVAEVPGQKTRWLHVRVEGGS